jgi:hypothetical protein
VQLHFVHKLDKTSGPLRDGSVDLATGVISRAIEPEAGAQAPFRDRYVGVVRLAHPLTKGKITPAWYAAAAGLVVVATPAPNMDSQHAIVLHRG